MWIEITVWGLLFSAQNTFFSVSCKVNLLAINPVFVDLGMTLVDLHLKKKIAFLDRGLLGVTFFFPLNILNIAFNLNCFC